MTDSNIKSILYSLPANHVNVKIDLPALHLGVVGGTCPVQLARDGSRTPLWFGNFFKSHWLFERYPSSPKSFTLTCSTFYTSHIVTIHQFETRGFGQLILIEWGKDVSWNQKRTWGHISTVYLSEIRKTLSTCCINLVSTSSMGIFLQTIDI